MSQLGGCSSHLAVRGPLSIFLKPGGIVLAKNKMKIKTDKWDFWLREVLKIPLTLFSRVFFPEAGKISLQGAHSLTALKLNSSDTAALYRLFCFTVFPPVWFKFHGDFNKPLQTAAAFQQKRLLVSETAELSLWATDRTDNLKIK